MLERGLIFIFGVVVAPVAKPVIGNVARPLAREVIKIGLLTGDAMNQLVQEVREDLQDLKAEAAAHLHQAEAGGTHHAEVQG